MDASRSPIFIVGAPRSGTTLLATILASHPQISCGAETHFFPYLEANYRQITPVLKDGAWPTQAVEFVAAIAVDDHAIADLFGVSRQSIYNYLAGRKPSIQALLESLTDQHRVATGKQRWAEKTPNHILHLPLLRRLYPTAKIVRIVRDPRDAALSMAAKLPWTSSAPLDSAYLIEQWYRQSKAFFDRDQRTYTLQYETLITQPKSTVQQLCDFLEEPFEPVMLEDTQAAAEHTAPAHETWKTQVGQGLDSSRCLAWQKRSPDTDLKAISTVCQEMIRDFNYRPLSSAFTPIFSCYTSDRFIRFHRQEIDALLAHGHLLVPCHPLQLPASEPVVYCDVPINGSNYGKSLKKFLRFCLTLGMLRLKRVTIKFSDFGASPEAEKNQFGKLAAHLLQRLGSPIKLLDLME